jgi:hypothetical protein
MLHQYRFASQRFAASGRVVGPSGECPWDANLCAGISAMSTALRDKYRKLLRSEFERSQPMSAFRCWAALQMGLATGSRPRVDRECKHLDGHPQYSARAREIQEAVRKRG